MAPSPMGVTLYGIVTLVRELHPSMVVYPVFGFSQILEHQGKKATEAQLRASVVLLIKICCFC